MKDDKKKMIVLGALGAVLLGVGAFSFLGGGGSGPKPGAAVASKDKSADGKAEVKVDEKGNPIAGAEGEVEPPQNPLYAAELPQRDPFASRDLPGEKIGGMPPSLPPPSQPVKKPSNGGRRNSPPPSYGGGGGGYTPVPLTGELPGVGGQVSITPEVPSYSLSGTMNGTKKIAVFTDAQGNQRLVPEGGSLDGDSKVVAIEKGSVTIESRGKKQRLSLGGNPK